MQRRSLARLAAALCTAAAAFSQDAASQPATRPASRRGAKPEVASFVLDNGLEVSLRAVPSAKDCAVAVFLRIGEDHDPEGRSGLAHAVEHLWCTSAAGSFPAQTYEEWAARHPHSAVNAQTASDGTSVAALTKPEDLAAELAEVAARFADLKPTAADLERERGRLTAEVGNMYGGMPWLAAINHARAAVRPMAKNGRPGGTDATFTEMTLPELTERWRRFYRAGNARIVVVGKFEREEVATTIRKLFGPLPRGEALPGPASRPAGPALEPRVIERNRTFI